MATITLTLKGEDVNHRKTSIEVDSLDILTVIKVGSDTVVTMNSSQQYTVLEELSDVELQCNAAGVTPPTGKDRRFVQIGVGTALAQLLDANNISTLQILSTRALANDVAFTNLATTLGLSLTQLTAYLMRAYGVNGFLPNSVNLPAVVVSKKGG